LSVSIEYFASHAAQLPVLGSEGQEWLRQASVHVSGAGRIGTSIVMGLRAAGIGHLSANDRQVMEGENMGASIFAKPSDLGKAKVLVLKEFLEAWPDLRFDALVAPTESSEVDPFIQSADLVISCANTVSGRLAADSPAA
jgi:molybdopterin/thiamine biosynthesis adenylyltransferase